MTGIKSIGSIYGLTEKSMQWFLPRLYPQRENWQSIWGCSSIRGFLRPGENLMTCVARDREILQKRKVSYKMISDKLKSLIEQAQKEGEDKLIEGRFQVTLSKLAMSCQVCPFSLSSDQNVGPFTPVKNPCGKGLLDVSMKNMMNFREIKFNTLSIHLIEEHHFFQGSVTYRLDPERVIDTLGLKPEKNFSLPPPNNIETLRKKIFADT